jgi:hypothetical protein
VDIINVTFLNSIVLILDKAVKIKIISSQEMSGKINFPILHYCIVVLNIFAIQTSSANAYIRENIADKKWI